MYCVVEGPRLTYQLKHLAVTYSESLTDEVTARYYRYRKFSTRWIFYNHRTVLLSRWWCLPIKNSQIEHDVSLTLYRHWTYTHFFLYTVNFDSSSICLENFQFQPWIMLNPILNFEYWELAYFWLMLSKWSTCFILFIFYNFFCLFSFSLCLIWENKFTQFRGMLSNMFFFWKSELGYAYKRYACKKK